jgi:hypothetical protein
MPNRPHQLIAFGDQQLPGHLLQQGSLLMMCELPNRSSVTRRRRAVGVGADEIDQLRDVAVDRIGAELLLDVALEDRPALRQLVEGLVLRLVIERERERLGDFGLDLALRQACRIFGLSRPSASAWRTCFSVMPYCWAISSSVLPRSSSLAKASYWSTGCSCSPVMAVISENSNALALVDVVQRAADRQVGMSPWIMWNAARRRLPLATE